MKLRICAVITDIEVSPCLWGQFVVSAPCLSAQPCPAAALKVLVCQELAACQNVSRVESHDAKVHT